MNGLESLVKDTLAGKRKTRVVFSEERKKLISDRVISPETREKMRLAQKHFTDEQIIDAYIRAHAGKESHTVIGDDHDMSQSTVSRIKLGKVNADITRSVVLP